MLGFNLDKRFIYVFIIIMVLMSLTSYLNNPDKLLVLILTLPAVLIAITFHEFAHAFAADRLGDDTPRRQGRLTLNPIAHLDPIGSIMLVFAGFGWGKPVEINPRNFNRNVTMSKGEAIVSIAGPLMNFLLAIIFTFVYFIIYKFAKTFAISEIGNIIMTLIQVTISINIGLGVFNLIPLPPLDGSKVLRNFLPYSGKQWMDNYSQIFYFIFIALWITGLAGIIISPIIGWIYRGIMKLGILIFGL